MWREIDSRFSQFFILPRFYVRENQILGSIYDKQMWWPKNLCVSKTGIEQEKGIRS